MVDRNTLYKHAAAAAVASEQEKPASPPQEKPRRKRLRFNDLSDDDKEYIKMVGLFNAISSVTKKKLAIQKTREKLEQSQAEFDKLYEQKKRVIEQCTDNTDLIDKINEHVMDEEDDEASIRELDEILSDLDFQMREFITPSEEVAKRYKRVKYSLKETTTE